MQNIFNNKHVQLAQGEVVALRIKGGIKLKVMRGRVWVTLQGDSADYWLCDGQQIDIPGYGILVVEAACGTCQVQVDLPRPQRQWRQQLVNAIQRVASVHTMVTVPLLLLVCISVLRLR
ncbi:hypothetical protein FHW67_003856 [Herbaspirillum sp. Sphag1AN]|uniref:DUF2917 domain-containing protein n=1 Tax=unclassified Herbaspirillum TaxID=2624150 RepID=UPI0016105168|nr:MULTISPECIES: DUF2917 domain-containing protein [unclassified Herbaspirillum]MBB3214538.1 hypothetical protein [Herbaspirillum sp. Sphag1AN]MBB3247622.1 hypothetical protein [Herbaspirillum sp. Sphag64]